MSSARALLVLAAGASIPSVASAQAIHVYGPRGSGSDRRAIVVLEDASGIGCVPADQIRLQAANPHTTVDLEQPLGSCARWVQVRTEGGPPSAAVRSAEGGPAVAVAMGSDVALRARAELRGNELHVQVTGAPQDEALQVAAVWDGGRTALAADGQGGFSGQVPPTGVIGVLARSATALGATAVGRPRAHRGPFQVVVMPSDLAVPAGGAPRTAAFVVVADRMGRLSTHVPLQITSRLGHLRALQWITPGVAAVELSADPGTDSVDLEVQAPGRLQPIRAQIPVIASWPIAASLEIDGKPTRGKPLLVSTRVRDLQGNPLPADRVRVRCGAEVEQPVAEPDSGRLSARCTPTEAGPLQIAAQALIDGRPVPLASRTVQVHPPPAPPVAKAQPKPQPAPAPAAPPPRPPPSHVTVGAYGHAGVDTWARPSFGVGGRIEVDAWSKLRLGGTVRYSATPYRASSNDIRTASPLDGTTHTLDVLLEPSAVVALGRYDIVGRLGLGVAWIRDRWRLDQAHAHGNGCQLALQAAAGPRLHFGRWDLDIEVGTRLWLVETLDDAAWPQARARFFVEVGGALRP